MRAFLLPIGSDQYALPIEAVREVVPRPLVSNLPTAPESIRGLFNVRGEIVPLLDTAYLLDQGGVDEFSYVVVVETDRGLAGLTVTGLPSVAELHEPMPAGDSPAAVATYAHDGRLVVLLDLASLASVERIGSGPIGGTEA